MFNKLVFAINLLTMPLLDIPIEILDFFELQENMAVFCSENVNVSIAQALLPYAYKEKKEYDAILVTNHEELESKILQLKAGGKGIAITPYGRDIQVCNTLKHLDMKIVHKEMYREWNDGEIERAYLIFFEKIVID